MPLRIGRTTRAPRWVWVLAAGLAAACLMGVAARAAAGEADQGPPPPAAPAARVEKGSAGIELHAQGEDLGTVLELLSRQAEVNIIKSKNVKGTVTADLYGVTPDQVLEAVCRANDLKWVREGDFVYVYTRQEWDTLQSADERLVTEVFHLNYLTADEAKKLITPALSKKGSTAETTPAETGIPAASTSAGGDSYGLPDTIVVRDFPEKLVEVRKILKRMDRRPRQVLVEATILSVALNDSMSLGVNFNALAGVDFRDLSTTAHPVTNTTTVPGTATTTVDVNNASQWGQAFTQGFASQGTGLNVGIITNNIAMFINALEEVSDTTILSNPKVLALNKQPAEVNIGDQIGYRGDVTSTETSQVSQAAFLDVGTVLRFRPFISDDGYVRMEVHPEVSDRGGETIDGVPSKATTQVTCNVMIKDGYTIVIGGLFREETIISREQIPGLGSVPGFGWLFRNKSDSTSRREIVILLTPHIIEEDEANDFAERVRDDAKRRCIGMREGFSFLTTERLTVRYLQEADEAYRQYEKSHVQADLDRAWWNTRLVLNIAPNNLHALRLKDKVLLAMDKGPRPPRAWTVWDKVSEYVKPDYVTDSVPQENATGEEGKNMDVGPRGTRPPARLPPTWSKDDGPVAPKPVEPAGMTGAVSQAKTVTVTSGGEDRK